MQGWITNSRRSEITRLSSCLRVPSLTITYPTTAISDIEMSLFNNTRLNAIV